MQKKKKSGEEEREEEENEGKEEEHMLWAHACSTSAWKAQARFPWVQEFDTSLGKVLRLFCTGVQEE